KRCTFLPLIQIHFGDNVFVGPECYFVCHAEIGNDVMFGPGVAMIGGDHEYRIPGKSIRESGTSGYQKIIIEDNVWIGYGAIILDGVHIGKRAVIGAGAIVTHDVADYNVVAGQ